MKLNSKNALNDLIGIIFITNHTENKEEKKKENV